MDEGDETHLTHDATIVELLHIHTRSRGQLMLYLLLRNKYTSALHILLTAWENVVFHRRVSELSAVWAAPVSSHV